MPGAATAAGTALHDSSAVVEGGRCTNCGALYYPRPAFCMACLSDALAPQPLSRTGTLYASTTIHVGSPRFGRPYTVGYVDLPEGLRLFGRVESPVAIGTEVDVGLGPIGTGDDGEPLIGVCFRGKDD